MDSQSFQRLALRALAWCALVVTAQVVNAETSASESSTQGSETSSSNWLDDGQAYASDQALALTEWMDSFFGDPVSDLEAPESKIRVRWTHTWDEEEDHKSRVRLRGKLRLPALSERLDLVFADEEGDDIGVPEAADDDDSVSLFYNVTDKEMGSRIDLTLTANSSGPKPGIRFRNRGNIVETLPYRFTQRVFWEADDGFSTRAELNLDYALSKSELLRWSNRAVYGEETDGVEWRSVASLRRIIRSTTSNHPLVVSYFGSIRGVTDPSYTQNYRLGLSFRQRLFRDYLYAELEPSYNFRKREGQEREGRWNIQFRLEIHFHGKRREQD